MSLPQHPSKLTSNPAASESFAKTRWYFFAVLFTAILFRLIYFQGFQDNPFFDYVGEAMDMETYDRGGKIFAEGDVWIDVGSGEGHAALYMYFLGMIYWIFGHKLSAVWLVQFALGVGGSMILFASVRRLADSGTALAAGLLFATNSILIYYEGLLLRESLALFLLLVSFFFFARGIYINPPDEEATTLHPLDENQFRSSRWDFLLGISALSLAVQVRPNFVLVLPLLLFYLYRGPLSRFSAARRWRWLGGYTLLFFGLMIPMLARGYKVFHELYFLDRNGPFLLLYSNLPQYPGHGYGRYPYFDTLLETNRAGLSMITTLGLILKNMVSDFQGFLFMYGKKVFYLFNNYDTPQNLSLYIHGKFSPVLRNPLSLMGITTALAVSGLAVSWKRKSRFMLVYVFLTGLFVSVILFIPLSRFRMVLIPWIIILGAYALNRIFHCLRQRSPVEGAVLVFMSLIIAGTLRVPEHLSAEPRFQDDCNLGVAYLKNTRLFDLGKAEHAATSCWNKERFEDLNHALGMPLLATVYHLYAAFLEEQGRGDEALPFVKHSLEISPLSSLPFKLLWKIYGEKNQTRQALRSLHMGAVADPLDRKIYQLAASFYNKRKDDFKTWVCLNRWIKIEKDPTTTRAIGKEMKRLDRRISKKMKKVNLYVSKARGYYLNQEWEPALREYAQLARYNRSDDNLYLELGIIYGNLLQYEDALTALYSGLLINPNNVEIHRLLSDYYLSASVRNSIMGFIHLTRYLEKAPDSKTRAGLKEKYDNLLAKFSARKMFPRLGSLTSSQNRDIHALYKGR